MSKVTAGSDGVTFTIDPGSIKPGQKVYITSSTGALGSIGMAIAEANGSSLRHDGRSPVTPAQDVHQSAACGEGKSVSTPSPHWICRRRSQR